MGDPMYLLQIEHVVEDVLRTLVSEVSNEQRRYRCSGQSLITPNKYHYNESLDSEEMWQIF